MKNDECFCEECKHDKASTCIQIACSCCLKADRIRLEHPVFEEEKEETEHESDEEEYEKGRQKAMWTDLGGLIGSSV